MPVISTTANYAHIHKTSGLSSGLCNLEDTLQYEFKEKEIAGMGSLPCETAIFLDFL